MSWLRTAISDTWFFIRHAFYALCVIIVAAFISFYVYEYVVSGRAAQDAPKAKVAAPIEPVKIALHGPQPRLVISQVSTILSAEITGPAGAPEWVVVPDGAGTITPFGSGMQADLVAISEGEFSVLVMVSGDGRQLAKAKMQVTAVPQMQGPPAGPPPANNPPPADTPPMPPPAPPVLTISQATVADLAQVNSQDRVREAHSIGSIINMLVGRINGGFIAPNADLASEIRRSVAFSLGDKSSNWSGFLDSMARNLATLRAQGVVYDSATAVRALGEIAGVLLSDR